MRGAECQSGKGNSGKISIQLRMFPLQKELHRRKHRQNQTEPVIVQRIHLILSCQEEQQGTEEADPAILPDPRI